jgi:HlyD family secretion protein
MQRRKGRWRYGWIGAGLLLVLAALGTSTRFVRLKYTVSEPPWKRLPKATVHRADLWVSVTTGGMVESSDRTVIECELENMDAGVNGQRLLAGGASTILSLVPQGTSVKKGDVLCRLDSSAYEELLYQQEMSVQRATADHRQAELSLDVARTAVAEYTDGLRLQTLQDLDGRIAQARAEWEHAADRFRWTKRMQGLGYIARGMIAAEDLNQQRAAYSLDQVQTESHVFQRYEVPRTIRQLQNAVTAAEGFYEYHTARLERHQRRLRSVKRQIERCTIRSPHDGFVIYASDPWGRILIEEGMTVRQKQRLFYLPNLSRMEVSSLLHESVVDRVHEGMRAKIHVEGLPDRILEGNVTSVAVLPTKSFFSDVAYYLGQVKIDSPPDGIRPGMTAEVEIQTGKRSDVLTVPSSAVAREDGHEVCYVASDETLERRPVEIGRATQDQLEVTRGLSEGEQVVLNPSSVDGLAAAAEDPSSEADSDRATPTH